MYDSLLEFRIETRRMTRIYAAERIADPYMNHSTRVSDKRRMPLPSARSIEKATANLLNHGTAERARRACQNDNPCETKSYERSAARRGAMLRRSKGPPGI
ncbi:hypothetical protein OKW43_004059 [Paraburkholderia sp. WC7.3g]|uniref:hypothetical protein n=1 Tax=Paraburkholderia sp. WC7.3g TaxID=2991070 RepID=UPI003D20577C